MSETNGQQTHAVTGALGFSGRYITRHLLARGHKVRTLTNSGRANPFGDDLEIFPLSFEDPSRLTKALEGVRVLYNTYWVRFNHGTFTRAAGKAHTLTLFECAKAAGVERVVHVSITNPSLESPFEYFRHKAELEAALESSGLSYAILRPAVLFGTEDVLINNIAWILRRVPIFGVFGDGSYLVQPIHVDDFARLAVIQGEAREDTTVNAVGPETFAFKDLVKELASILGKRRLLVPLPPSIGYLIGRLIGLAVGDVLLTRDEIGALMSDLLHVDAPPAGSTRLTEWAKGHADTLGSRYASELARRRVARPADHGA